MNTYKILKDNTKRLKKLYFKQTFDKVALVAYCVDKSTIRAFQFRKGHVKLYKPLSIFRVWAFNYLSDKKVIDSLKARQDFEEVRKSAVKDLKGYWNSTDGGTPEFYQFNKLIDLFFKCLPLWTDLNDETKEWIFENTHGALDKFSLDLLRRWSKKSDIPVNASMKFIDKRKYNKLQKEIKVICRDIPVIIFDLFAWDENHRPKELFELIELDKKKNSPHSS